MQLRRFCLAAAPALPTGADAWRQGFFAGVYPPRAKVEYETVE